jgi:2-keto-4-pentenoate hydratase/2-oxohepta-3-ene-1,7-dioic acid hydratase in catechol pathway
VERIARFLDDAGEEHFGVFTNPSQTSARIAMQDAETGKLSLSTVERAVSAILAPLEPPAVWCVGLNYACHAAEVKMPAPPLPILFTKAVTSLTGHRSSIVLPACAPGEVDYEGELGVVIGREAKNVKEEEALSYVMGYVICNDVTARKWQGKKGGGQWLRGKSFDTFLPCGPHITPAEAVPNPQDLRIRTLVNDELVQDGNTSQMLVPVAKLISYISQGTTLLPGTLILTGTPSGVGYTRGVYLKRGDTVSITIDGLGTLTNTCVEDD